MTLINVEQVTHSDFYWDLETVERQLSRKLRVTESIRGRRM